MDLEEESATTAKVLKYKKVAVVCRLRENEIIIKFKDGTMLIVDSKTPLELSITQKHSKKHD